MRILWVVLVTCLAAEAGAVEIVSLYREVTYVGGLESPGMMGDTQSSLLPGSFNEGFSETLSAPPNAEAAANVSQLSYVEVAAGTLSIDVAGDSGTHATTLAAGLVADAYAESRLELVFTTSTNAQLSVDIVISSGLGLFYDGPGAGGVGSSHIASFLLCVSGGGCLADLLVDDVTDNGQAVADGILGSIEIPPGTYEVELIAISQVISFDEGSSLGSAGFSGEITVEPVPEAGQLPMLMAGIAFLASLEHRRQFGGDR